MPEDFHDHMKKEQELLNLSYQESLRQKTERMAVWEPKDKMTVLSQIKKLIEALYRGLKSSRYLLYPGILLILLFLVFGLLAGCTTLNWPWKDKEVMVPTNPLVIPPSKENTIACIKLEPECDSHG